MAAQRVAQQRGFRAWDRVGAITKRANDIATTFEGVAERNWCDDDSLTRTDALRKTPLEDPRLYKMLQRV
jgi:hypothetical protein